MTDQKREDQLEQIATNIAMAQAKQKLHYDRRYGVAGAFATEFLF